MSSDEQSLDALERKVKELEENASLLRDAQEALTLSESSYRYIVENANDIIYRIDTKGYFLFFNPAAIRLTGYSEGELRTKHYLELIRPDYRESAKRLYISQLEDMIPSTYYEFPMIGKGGNELWLGQHVQLMKNFERAIGFHAVARDITDKKREEEKSKGIREDLERQVGRRTAELEKYNEELKKEVEARREAEEKLRENSQELEFLYRTAIGFVEALTEEEHYQLICKRVKELTGDSFVLVNSFDKGSRQFRLRAISGLGKYTERVFAFLGKSPVGYTTTLTDEKAENELKKGILAKGPNGLHELSFGTLPKPIAFAIERLLGLGEIYVIGFVRNEEFFGNAIIITRTKSENGAAPWNRKLVEAFVNQASVALLRKRLEEELRASEGRYRLLAENVSDIIWTLSLEEKRFTYISPSVLKIRGFTPEEAMEMSLEQHLSPRSMKDVSEILWEELSRDGEAGVDPNRSRTVELEQLYKDGTYKWCEATVNFIRNEEGQPVNVLGISRDISQRRQAEKEKKELEARLQESRKMETIALLAGGVAHQFNNALSVISMSLGTLETGLPVNGRTANLLLGMKLSVDKMSHLTDQLLAYARGGKYRARVVSMGELMEIALPLVEHAVKPAIRLDKDIPEGLWNVDVDTTQIQMVLSAILTNASEAIENEGHIAITCRNKEIIEKEIIEDAMLSPGRYVCLAVKDSGKGMDEETRGKIFDPFFTTKFQGRGLGMAAAYGIVKNHGGFIFIDSAIGKGTNVRVYIPCVDQCENGGGAYDRVGPGKNSETLHEEKQIALEFMRTSTE